MSPVLDIAWVAFSLLTIVFAVYVAVVNWRRRVVSEATLIRHVFESTRVPKVGIGVMIVRRNPDDGYPEVLLGKRKGSHGAGEYAWPGGHFEYMESFEDTILREIAEECGPDLRVHTVQLLCVNNIKRYAPKHYADLGFVAQWDGGEPVVAEPHKCESWGWYPMHALPEPLFETIPNYIEAYTTGRNLFDA